ncbi:MAG: SusD/RagB family nutrient-binding outer membrane lipoprotein, partial [Bacteroidales bacterium]|nr:SusD/RagB family nutrient-binding outer membrane lipoprotein [Bacteroidales bacterium]
MKTIKISNKKIIGLGFVLLFLVFGCTKNFEELNVNPNEPVEVPTSYLLTDGQKGLMSFLWDEWWNGRFGMLYSQYWSQASYTDESRYKPREGVNNNYWIFFYAGRDVNPPDGELNGGGMMSLQRIIDLNEDPETAAKSSQYGSNNNQIAVARILKAWMFQILTDTWGYIPYSEALNIANYDYPAYDSQEGIYYALLDELTAAVDQMDDGAGPSGDMIYGGNMENWKKFANSLKLRIAIRMSNIKEGDATTAINEAMASGVFESNADNAQLIFETGKPNNNPLNENQKTRSDFAVSKTFIDFLVTRNDPRIDFYANTPNYNLDSVHVGFPYGMTNTDATPILVETVSMPGNCVYAPQAPAFYMNYAEVCFILAEAAERGIYSGGGDAKTWYEAGISASMNMWNDILAATPTGWKRIDGNDDIVPYVTDILPDPIGDISSYLADPLVAWDGGVDQSKLIAEQKYIALYPQGLQAWFEWRRTGYPE